MTAGWGCDYEGGAYIFGSMGEDGGDEEDKARGPLDIYLLSPQLNAAGGILSVCTNGAAPGCQPGADEQLDVMIIIGDVGGGDDIFVGSLSDLWVGCYDAFARGEFDLTGLLPGGPFRIGFRYYCQDDYDNVLVDQVVFTVEQPGRDCNNDGVPDECDLCGDLDGDGEVGYDDYVIFLSAFGGVTDGSPAEDYCCDYDGSGAVGLADYDAWLNCYRDFTSDPYAGPPTKRDARKRRSLDSGDRRELRPESSLRR